MDHDLWSDGFGLLLNREADPSLYPPEDEPIDDPDPEERDEMGDFESDYDQPFWMGP